MGESVGEDVEASSSATSKSTVSELFIERTATALSELMSRRLDDVRLAVMMLDGMEIAERTHVVALGISTEGVKTPLGLWEGSTENATLARTLLADLVDRGLDPEQAILFVTDGGKALRHAIKDVFGEHALVHRCHRHYPDLRVIPTRSAGPLGSGRVGPVGVGIIRVPAGRRGACRAVCSVRVACGEGSSLRWLVL